MFYKIMTGALMAAALVSAAQAAPVKKGDVAAAEARPDDVVCTYEQNVGSHLKKRVCATRSVREERARADQDTMQRMGRSGGHAVSDPKSTR